MLSVVGTGADDRIVISQDAKNIYVTGIGAAKTIPITAATRSPITSIVIQSGVGDDKISISGNKFRATVWSGGGNDRVDLTDSNLLDGSFVWAGCGDDLVWGSAGSDGICGEEGNDDLYGGFGNDFLLGFAGNDQLHGEDGDDSLYGDQGSDLVSGGSGDDDTKHPDDWDTLISIERINRSL